MRATRRLIRRKRQLIIDERVELTGDEIRAQLHDTSVICAELVLAPTSKRAMLDRYGAAWPMPGRCGAPLRVD